MECLECHAGQVIKYYYVVEHVLIARVLANLRISYG
jgi:hypothetical protein